MTPRNGKYIMYAVYLCANLNLIKLEIFTSSYFQTFFGGGGSISGNRLANYCKESAILSSHQVHISDLKNYISIVKLVA